MPTRAVVELKLRRRLQEKGLAPEEIEMKAAKYMREYDLKEKHREQYLAGKSSIEKANANALFEIEWSKIRKQILNNETS